MRQSAASIIGGKLEKRDGNGRKNDFRSTTNRVSNSWCQSSVDIFLTNKVIKIKSKRVREKS